MGLYDMSDGSLMEVPPTTFSAEKVFERANLQRALRENIGVIGPDLLVVAEEFGDFVDVRRRIDLLCVDQQARLVVVELKRTEDGGHMELQAIRYAAMVSTMTFDQLVETYERHLAAGDPDSMEAARARLAEWLEDAGGEDAIISREVRIVLVSAGFDPQITTTVLWLNDVFAMDIRCIRLTLYRVEGRLLLDVQPVIPLPEAEELTVQLRRRETAARAASASGRDRTQYVVVSPTGRTQPLPKRKAILKLAHELHEAGVSAEQIASALPRSMFLRVEGVHSGDELTRSFIATYPPAQNGIHRWFLDEPFHEAGRTWVLSNQWGPNTVAALAALVALGPAGSFAYEPA